MSGPFFCIRFASTIDEVMLQDDFLFCFVFLNYGAPSYITQRRPSVLKDACAALIADLLERQTHGIVAVQKRSCFKKHTGTAILLR